MQCVCVGLVSPRNMEKMCANDEPMIESREQTEDNKIQEYLQRSDTAVIFAEPVDKVDTKSESNKNGFNERSGQSVTDSIKGKQKNQNVSKSDENNCSSNKSKFSLVFIHLNCVSMEDSKGR